MATGRKPHTSEIYDNWYTDDTFCWIFGLWLLSLAFGSDFYSRDGANHEVNIVTLPLNNSILIHHKQRWIEMDAPDTLDIVTNECTQFVHFLCHIGPFQFKGTHKKQQKCATKFGDFMILSYKIQSHIHCNKFHWKKEEISSIRKL